MAPDLSVQSITLGAHFFLDGDAMPEESQEFTLFGHARSGNVYKVALMLALTGTPFVFRHVDLDQGEQRKDEYLAINPFGKVPVLKHGRQFIRQSNTILIYLSSLKEQYGARDAAERVRISEWLFWEQEAVFPGIGRTRFLSKFGGAEAPVIAFFRHLGENALERIEAQLAETKFLAGPGPSIADIAVYAYARLAEEAGFDTRKHPKTAAWRAAIEALPGWNSPENLLK